MTDPRENVAAEQPSDTSSNQPPARDAEQIAEEWAAKAARWMVRSVVRAKEEAEDIWADAQAIRRDL